MGFSAFRFSATSQISSPLTGKKKTPTSLRMHKPPGSGGLKAGGEMAGPRLEIIRFTHGSLNASKSSRVNFEKSPGPIVNFDSFPPNTGSAKCRDCPYPGCVKRHSAQIPAKAFFTSSVKFPTVNYLAFSIAPQAAKPFRKASAFWQKTVLFCPRFLSF